jgi:hypothetical protein
VTIPVAIREKLGLKSGQLLDFDETAPFLKAVPVLDEDQMHAVVGCIKGRLGGSSEEWLDQTRGPVEKGDE